MGGLRGWVGYLRVELTGPMFSCLKDRRSWIRSVQDQARGKFNVSLADLSPDGDYGAVALGFALASSCNSELIGRIEAVKSFVARMAEDNGLEILDFLEEVFCDDDLSD
ncbi:MAG: DUF503 domain-containing protein [Thermanaerothrix sp.]|nr:DUF503 domain-containing protein [Thermanaerothrix sp.]